MEQHLHQVTNILSLSTLFKSLILISCLSVIGSADTDSYTINYIIPAPPPNITAWWNDINGWNQTSMNVNAGNSVVFNVTIDQSVINVSWKVEGSEEQNTSNLQFTRVFNTIGNFNVTAQSFNTNGSSNIIYTVVTVTSTGGGGTDYDYAYGWVKWDNGTAVNYATIATSEGNEYTDVSGYYSFGYIFEHGQTYNFNISKSGSWNNQSIFFATGDYEVVNGTLTAPPAPQPPNIISWGNDNTLNNDIIITIQRNTNITFNITANQSVTTVWTGTALPTKINGTDAIDSYAFKNFTVAGIYTVITSCSNSNGSCLNSVTWTITVTELGSFTLSGYVQNNLGVSLQNARIDFNGNYGFTNVTGYYEFTNITEGNYSVLARAISYQNSTITETIASDTTMNFTLSENVYVTKDDVDNAGALGFVGGILGAVMVIAILRRKTIYRN